MIPATEGVSRPVKANHL